MGRPRTRSLRGLRALVVDDNATSRSILQRQVEAWHLTVDSAADGAAALAMLQDARATGSPYDVAIVDESMPGMSGLELARQIKAQPPLEDLPIVLLMPLGIGVGVDEREQVGPLEEVTRPVVEDELRAALCELQSRRSSDEQVAWSDSSPGSGPDGGLALQVLVVEDNVVNRKVVVLMLEALGCEADVAQNGVEALELLARGSYDVALMDCRMPVMDGYAAARSIRREEVEQGGERLAIIGVTANATPEDRQMCLAAGMDSFLGKPFRIDQLRSVLQRHRPSAPDLADTA